MDRGGTTPGPLPRFSYNFGTFSWLGWSRTGIPERESIQGDWAESGRVITYQKLKWAVFSHEPYKDPGVDGIMRIMLLQVFELFGRKRFKLLIVSVTLGYIPMSWRHAMVVFIPKPGKPVTQSKSLRPICLMSFMLKILEKLLDGHIRVGVLVENPLHQNEFA
jgi:hypothetical protein